MSIPQSAHSVHKSTDLLDFELPWQTLTRDQLERERAGGNVTFGIFRAGTGSGAGVPADGALRAADDTSQWERLIIIG